MGAYNEELVKAGVMLAGEGLLPSSKGARVRFDKDGNTTVIDGPFAETKELVAGFWILEVSSREEVIEWVRKAPVPGRRDRDPPGRPSAEDFGDAMTPELREQEDRLRATVDGAARGLMTASCPTAGDRGPAPRRRRRLAHGVGEADRARSPASPATSAWPRSSPRTRWSRRWSGGRRPASPHKPGAWLMATAKHRAIDTFRRAERLERKTAELGRELAEAEEPDWAAAPRRGGRGRRPAAGLHLLPPGALPRGAGGAHAAAARRPHHRRDRPRVPRRRVDGGAADRAGQAHAHRRPGAVRGADRRGVHRPARLGARGDLPGLQRGLRGDRGGGLGPPGAVPGGAAAGPHPRRAHAGGVRGARPGRAHGDPGVAAARPGRARPASRCCWPTRTAAAGTAC